MIEGHVSYGRAGSNPALGTQYFLFKRLTRVINLDNILFFFDVEYTTFYFCILLNKFKNTRVIIYYR